MEDGEKSFSKGRTYLIEYLDMYEEDYPYIIKDDSEEGLDHYMCYQDIKDWTIVDMDNLVRG